MTMTPVWTRLGIGLGVVALTIVGAAASARAGGIVSPCTQGNLDTALAGGGLVTFNCGGPATITVTSTKTIGKDTTIDGGGQVTISGGNAVELFGVNSGITFTVRNLTIANGYSTGGLGGAIYNNGTLNVTNSTFSDNHADNSGAGGAIWNRGILTVINSTFSGNHADGAGGGIYNSGGTLTVINSTFSDNSAGAGGGISNTSFPTLGTLTLTNTIIANSTNGDCVNSATVTDGGHNLIEDTGANACGLTNGTNGNIIGVDPNLAALANNGGPTQTMAVLSGSAAINAGDEAVCAAAPVNGLDQRGYVRPGGGYPNCTIGAFEFGALPPRYTGPALSPVGLLGLGALLGAVGWRKARGASGAC